MAVKSVYNFVAAPEEKDVFKPDWAEQVSHDIPFSDGESGEIELKLTAETPIFIRNGHSKDQEENEFSNFIDADGNKKYFIPATSLKGMFRNVLEIMTSSRMRQIKGIYDNSFDIFGMRDMYNDEYSKKEIRNIKSGWLKRSGNRWTIYPCEIHRISIKNIESKFGLTPNELKGLNAVEKYVRIGFGTTWSVEKFSFVSDLGRFLGQEYNIDPSGGFDGSIVMFGDIDNKRYDFIFSKAGGEAIDVDSKLIDRFESLEDFNENSLWKYFRNKSLDKIPVFYKEEIIGQKKCVKHFGFSKLYRLNDSYYLNELNPIKSYFGSSDSEKLDLAETIFGQTRSGNALKGRVYFSHAICTSGSEDGFHERVLNSPKASFYPAYIKQEGTNGRLAANSSYNTYRKKEGELRGFKRYPVHINIKENIETENENISSKFKPLIIGSTFIAKIRFHNLRKVEIGALLCSISFHANQNRFFHSIGGAKPFGFGKIRVEVSSLEKYKPYLQTFEELMNQQTRDWINSKNLKELMSIASETHSERTENLLRYPVLEPRNEFNHYKIDREFLEDYSVRNGEFSIGSLLNDQYYHEVKSSQEKEEREKVEQQQIEKEKEKQRMEGIELNRFTEALEANNSNTLEQFVKDFPNSNKIEKVKERILLLRKEKIETDIKLKHEVNLAGSFKGKLDLDKAFLNEFYKKNKHFTFSEHQKTQIEENLKICWKEDRQAFMYKRKRLAIISEFPWTDIKKWLGESSAQSLFQKLNQST